MCVCMYVYVYKYVPFLIVKLVSQALRFFYSGSSIAFLVKYWGFFSVSQSNQLFGLFMNQPLRHGLLKCRILLVYHKNACSKK